MKVQKFLHVFPHHTYNVYRCRFSRPNRRRSPLVDRLRLGEPLREDSSFISYRLPIITAFIVSEVLFETLKGEEKVLKKALR